MKPSALPPVSVLRDLLRYDRVTGKLFWRRSRCGVRVGTEAGSPTPQGYRRVKIGGRLYLSHRVAFAMSRGRDPGAHEVDHADRRKGNAREDNLRRASRSQNRANGGPYRNNKTGLRGVSWHKQHRKYCAVIQCNKRSHHLGLFHDARDAGLAYDKAALKLFGKFARLNFPRK